MRSIASPAGRAQALLIGDEFIAYRMSALVLGDNLFFGHDFQMLLRNADGDNHGGTVFVYQVDDPRRYDVAERFDNDMLARYSRRTQRLETIVHHLGLALVADQQPVLPLV